MRGQGGPIVCCSWEDELMAALRGPWPPPQPSTLRRAVRGAWPGHCGLPRQRASEESGDRDVPVSSGCLSGSSGGHRSSTPPHGAWREQRPQQPRGTDPRLELLRDKIRCQVRWPASSASLGTSAPSSTSYCCTSSSPALQGPPCPALAPATGERRGKARKLKSGPCRGEQPPQCPASGTAAKNRDSELVGVYAWRKGRALAKALLGPPAPPRFLRRAPQRDLTPAAELGTSSTSRAAQSLPSTSEPSAASICSNNLVLGDPSSLSCEAPGALHSALPILRDLRQQIQTRLDQAQAPGRGLEPGPRDLRGRRQPWKALKACGPFSRTPQAGVEGQGVQRAGSLPCAQHGGTQRHRDPLFRRPRSPPDRLKPAVRRPCSASARWDSWAPRTSLEDEDAPSWVPRSPPAQQSWSASSTPRPVNHLPPWGTKLAWQTPTHEAPQKALGKEVVGRQPPPCPRPLAALGQRHSSESLWNFMRQRTLARKRQAQQQKAAAVRAQQLRKERLQDVYRLQREAILGTAPPAPRRAAPRVSQTNPSIVTFVPSSAQFSDPLSLGAPRKAAQEWSKVTSGTVLGDREAPNSFCLCLSHTELLEPGSSCYSLDGVSQPTRASTWPRSLTTRYPPSGVYVCLASNEARHLGTRGPLHFQQKQARLRALETMANVLKQRIETLTATLRSSDPPRAPGNPDSELPLPRLELSAAPTTPDGALLPNRSPEAWQDCLDLQVGPLHTAPSFLDCRTLSWTGHHSYEPRGLMKDRARPCREKVLGAASRWAPSTCLESLTTSDTTCGSLWSEKMPTALQLGLVTSCTDQSFGQCGGEAAARESLHFLQARKQLAEKRPVSAGPQHRPGRGHLRPVPSWSPKARRRAYTDTSSSMASPERFCTTACWALQEGPKSGASVELSGRGSWHSPSQEPATTPCPWDQPFLQELRAKNQDALLRLREMALEEKVRTELAWTDQRQGLPSSRATLAALSTLGRKQQAALDRLEQQQREMRSLRRLQRSENRARKLLLEQQRDLALVQRSIAQLQHELWVRSRLAQGSHQQVMATEAVAPKTCPLQEGPAQGPSRHPQPCAPSIPQPWRGPESPRMSQPPGAPSAADGALQSPGVVWDKCARSNPVQETQDELGAPQDQELPWALLSPPKQEATLDTAETQGHNFQVSPLSLAAWGVSCAPADGHQTLETEMQELSVGDAPRDDQSLEGSTWGPSTQLLSQEGLSECPGTSEAPSSMPSLQSGGSGEQRKQPWQTDPQDPCRMEATQQSTSPVPRGAGTPSVPGSGSTHSLSWPSLQGFLKVSAVRVQLSHTSSSLSDPPDSHLDCSGASSALGSGQGSWVRLEVSGAPLQSSPVLSSPRPGSDLSVASSEVWGEDFLPVPGACSDLEDGRVSGEDVRVPGGAYPEVPLSGHPQGQLSLEQSRSWSSPHTPAKPQAAPGDPTQGGSSVPSCPEEAIGGLVAEASLLPSFAEDTCLLPPLPPESEASAQSHSEDFPPPPEDSLLSTGSSRSPLGDDSTAPERPCTCEACPEEEPGQLSPGVVGGQCPQPTCPALPTGTPEAGGAVQMLLGGGVASLGGEETMAVDLVSTQLSRRILCDSLATLSELPEEVAGASRVPGASAEATGPRGRQRC